MIVPYMSEGIFIGVIAFVIYIQMTIIPLSIYTTPSNYRGEVVLLLFAVFILHVVLPFFKIISTGTVFASLS